MNNIDMKDMDNMYVITLAKCEICGFEAKHLRPHLRDFHNMLCSDYKFLFPNAKIIHNPYEGKTAKDTPRIAEIHLKRTATMRSKGLFRIAAQKTAIKRKFENNYPQKYKGLSKEQCPELIIRGDKISKTLRDKHMSGEIVSTRLGKTKENCPSIARVSQKTSETRKRLFREGKLKCKGGIGIGGYRSDLGHYVRSRLEANFCRILNYNHIRYIYEPQTFTLMNIDTTYLPDLYLPNQNLFIELKGRPYLEGEIKIETFKNQYPQYKLCVIYQHSRKWKTLKDIYKFKINNWEY